MNDQLQSQLATILQQFSATMASAGDIAVKELPEIAQQYIVYGYWKSLLSCIVCVAFIIALIVAILKIVRWANNSYDDGVMVVATVPAFLLIFPISSFFDNAQSLILNVTAPKVWLLLEIKSLIS